MDGKTRGASVGLADILLIAFIILKLTHVIEWPWIWVLSPFWIPLLILVVSGVVLVCVKVCKDAKLLDYQSGCDKHEPRN